MAVLRSCSGFGSFQSERRIVYPAACAVPESFFRQDSPIPGQKSGFHLHGLEQNVLYRYPERQLRARFLRPWQTALSVLNLRDGNRFTANRLCNKNLHDHHWPGLVGLAKNNVEAIRRSLADTHSLGQRRRCTRGCITTKDRIVLGITRSSRALFRRLGVVRRDDPVRVPGAGSCVAYRIRILSFI